MTTIYSLRNHDRTRSLELLKLTPEYGKGECYASACLGQTRLITAASERGDHLAAHDLKDTTLYVQGWFLWRFRDGSGISGFPHGFLLDLAAAERGQPCIVDAVFLRYALLGDPFWLPVQCMTFEQVDRYIDSPTTSKCWPLTTRQDGRELEDRLSFQAAYRRAEQQLASALELG